ncbi:hypothetical protein ACSBR1_039761 [Camellia fascicularis]
MDGSDNPPNFISILNIYLPAQTLSLLLTHVFPKSRLCSPAKSRLSSIDFLCLSTAQIFNSNFALQASSSSNANILPVIWIGISQLSSYDIIGPACSSPVFSEDHNQKQKPLHDLSDLGQTTDSNRTLEHYMSNPIKGQAVLFAGDLSYADDHPNHDNTKKKPILSSHICTAIMYPTRHPRVLPHFGIQLSVHRHISLFFLLTQPMGNIPRNTNGLNKSSQRLTDMKLHGSLLFYMLHGTIPTTTITWKEKERISNIKYNITNGLSLPIRDINAPVYITIGDGGNTEGIANNFIYPQPNYSAYREASFGHAIRDIKNRTHAYYCWQCNQDNEPVVADSAWFFNRLYLFLPMPNNNSRLDDLIAEQ